MSFVFRSCRELLCCYSAGTLCRPGVKQCHSSILVSYNKLGNTWKTSASGGNLQRLHSLSPSPEIKRLQLYPLPSVVFENKLSNTPLRHSYSDFQAAGVQKLILKCLRKYQKNKFVITILELIMQLFIPPLEYFFGSCKSKEISIPAFSSVSLQSVLVILMA